MSPPLLLKTKKENKKIPVSEYLRDFLFVIERAENETRTRDPNLGKVMLYQLSYFRKMICEEKETRTPTT